MHARSARLDREGVVGRGEARDVDPDAVGQPAADVTSAGRAPSLGGRRRRREPESRPRSPGGAAGRPGSGMPATAAPVPSAPSRSRLATIASWAGGPNRYAHGDVDEAAEHRLDVALDRAVRRQLERPPMPADRELEVRVQGDPEPGRERRPGRRSRRGRRRRRCPRRPARPPSGRGSGGGGGRRSSAGRDGRRRHSRRRRRGRAATGSGRRRTASRSRRHSP